MTILERLSLADTIALRRAEQMRVDGFPEDTLVRAALEAIAGAAGDGSCFEARIEKRVPVAAGLGGGSSDAAAALRLASELFDAPIVPAELHRIAATLGADVPFFLRDGAQLATGDGTQLAPIELPRGYVVLLVLPDGATKTSTADVYAEFDRRRGERGFEERCAALRASTARLHTARDLARLPRNDLAASPLAEQLVLRGAFRADVAGAGPVVYGLFDDAADAKAAAEALAGIGRTWIAEPG
jgi:4-diphosphocytidyl-2-C-methyl-D-erythritol kinase